jgi:hypothetical protein
MDPLEELLEEKIREILLVDQIKQILEEEIDQLMDNNDQLKINHY